MWTRSSYLDLADLCQVPGQQGDGQLPDLAVQQQVVSGQAFLLQGRLRAHLLPLELRQLSDVGGLRWSRWNRWHFEKVPSRLAVQLRLVPAEFPDAFCFQLHLGLGSLHLRLHLPQLLLLLLQLLLGLVHRQPLLLLLLMRRPQQDSRVLHQSRPAAVAAEGILSCFNC